MGRRRTSFAVNATLASFSLGLSLLCASSRCASAAFLSSPHQLPAFQRPHSVELRRSTLAMSSSAEGGGKYRPCAGALVFNREKKLLCGNRKDVPGSWQLPQGGIDEGEEPAAGAGRELYEEMGLKCPGDVVSVKTLDETISYDVPPGTWLEKQGYAGQRMHWTLYFYPGSDLPNVDLSGLGGEKPEFTEVQWMTWPELLAANEFKRSLNEKLQHLAEPVINSFTASL